VNGLNSSFRQSCSVDDFANASSQNPRAKQDEAVNDCSMSSESASEIEVDNNTTGKTF
jgi:hypothetical protein